MRFRMAVMAVVALTMVGLFLAGCAKTSDVQQMLNEELKLLDDKLSAGITETQREARDLMAKSDQQSAQIDSLERVVAGLRQAQAGLKQRTDRVEADDRLQVADLQGQIKALRVEFRQQLETALATQSERINTIDQAQARLDTTWVQWEAAQPVARQILDQRIDQASRRDKLGLPAFATSIIALGIWGLHVSN